MDVNLVKADETYIEAISSLVNLSYRGQKGWTKETEIVSGARSTIEEAKDYLLNPCAHLLIVRDGNAVIACICVEIKESSGYIGYFAVHPEYQGQGLGKIVLAKAEEFAKDILKVSKYIMVVVSQRTELIKYYERRGYERTGKVLDYPSHLNVGTPLRNDLTIEYLEKNA